MSKARGSDIKTHKRPPGRPAIAGRGVESVPVLVRLSPEVCAELDRWIAVMGKKNAVMGRPEAIRLLIERGLKAKR
jgi:hypothetical protein